MEIKAAAQAWRRGIGKSYVQQTPTATDEEKGFWKVGRRQDEG